MGYLWRGVMKEIEIALLLCQLFSGASVEAAQTFAVQDRARQIRVDCETPTHVIEVGLDDSASSRDSVHQAILAAELTGKTPMVVVIDRDGQEGRYEQELRRVTRALGVPYARCRQALLIRWRQTAPWRAAGVDRGQDDLPVQGFARSLCDLSRAMRVTAPPDPAAAAGQADNDPGPRCMARLADRIAPGRPGSCLPPEAVDKGGTPQTIAAFGRVPGRAGLGPHQTIDGTGLEARR